MNTAKTALRTARAVCQQCGQAIPPAREIVHREDRFAVVRESVMSPPLAAFVVELAGPGGDAIRVSGAYETKGQARKHLETVKALLADLKP